jgi:predicted nucleotidyltransferase
MEKMIPNEIRDTLRIVSSSLHKHKVDCMLIGGTAVGFYGYQRISGISVFNPEMKSDLDFWYNPTVENFINIVKALSELNVETSELEKIIFDPQKTYLKIPFEKFHIDFLPMMKGLSSYVSCKKNARKEVIDDNEFFVIGLSDLIANKIAIGRDIDKDDLDYLNKLKEKNK